LHIHPGSEGVFYHDREFHVFFERLVAKSFK